MYAHPFIFAVKDMDLTIFRNRKSENILLLPPGDLAPNPMQPRLKFDDDGLTALCESIKRYGVIQPIAVRKIEPSPFPCPQIDAKYEIIAGERRWRAAKLAGIEKIPCVLISADRSDSAAMAIVENVQRCGLSYFEEAIAIQNLILLTGKTQSEVAQMLSMTQPALSNKLRLLRLSERERLLAAENGFSERQARALVRIESERERRAVILRIIGEELSSAETEKLVSDVLSGIKEPPPGSAEAKKPAKKRKIKTALKDMRLIYNTVERTVKTLCDCGIKARWDSEENENEAVFKITVELSAK